MLYMDVSVEHLLVGSTSLEKYYKESQQKPNTLYGLSISTYELTHTEASSVVQLSLATDRLRTGWENWVRHYGANIELDTKFGDKFIRLTNSWLESLSNLAKQFNNADKYPQYPNYIVVRVNPRFKRGSNDTEKWADVMQKILNTGVVDALVLNPVVDSALKSGAQYVVTSVAPWSNDITLRYPNYEGVLNLLTNLNMLSVKPFLAFDAKALQFIADDKIPLTKDTRDGTVAKERHYQDRTTACGFYQAAGTSSRVDSATLSTYFQRLNDTDLFVFDTPQNMASKACMAAQRHQFQGGYSVFTTEYAEGEKCDPIKLENGTEIKGKHAIMRYIRTLTTRTFGGADCAQVPV
ncbi:uncharacterized protein LOC135399697 [Ornithodoros turicata]|uniref:uncharacterized protein LOC135399697 n=1 Tax=Ornithodoros turicata TaxID=34597 RepID=UPI00313880AD